ncbi:hypothetical protein GLX30_30395 [Streptomyces sp. Tu 2975]|uniref:hypothetical protein n=1 Tax=Streptomyces sp. Tu 2975 TaxID=2676871 RepID=UPI001357E7AC|nr:hypothetical protein [Streptomyces sp. Tu 2975]QIP87625.1 hypothetical protein GLX30_30395 [Streptomyces sp. Tu 2975]
MSDDDTRARGANGKYIRTLQGAEMDAEAARLRSKGWSFQRIADELGYSNKGNAWRAVDAVLQATVQEAGDELRRLERERLDRLAEAAWGVLDRQHVTVSNGRIVSLGGEPLPDDGPVLAAIDRLLRISESRRKLEGLDAPSRVSVDAESLGNEIGAILDRLGGVDGDSA